MNCLQSIATGSIYLNFRELADSFEELSKRVCNVVSSIFLDLKIVFYSTIYGINTSFHNSIEYKNTWFSPSVLLFFGADINAIDQEGFTPLHRACGKGHTQTVKLLIESGANVNAASPYGLTPLHRACEEGHTEIVRLLIESEANINAVSPYGLTPLHKACGKGHTEIVRLLIESGAYINAGPPNSGTPLHRACEEGHTEIVRLLIESGANINAPGNFGLTPLHWTCLRERVDIAQLLIQHGADLQSFFIANLELANFIKEVVESLPDHLIEESLVLPFLMGSRSSETAIQSFFQSDLFDMNLVLNKASLNEEGIESIFACLPTQVCIGGEFVSKQEALNRLDPRDRFDVRIVYS